MSDSTKAALSIVSGLALVGGFISLVGGTPIQVVALSLVLMIGGVMGVFLLLSRIAAARQPVDDSDRSTHKRLNTRVTVFGLLAAGTLVVSLKQLANPVRSTDRIFGIAGIIIALLLALLAFRAYRKMRSAPTAADLKPQTELGNPKAVLIGIIIFAALFIAGNTRRIMSGRTNDVWIGVGQSAIWLPIFGYFGYREYRKMKSR